MVGKRIVVGEFGRPHGVRGLLRLNAFTADPTAVTAYGPLSDEAGTRHFSLTLKGPDLVAVEGVRRRRRRRPRPLLLKNEIKFVSVSFSSANIKACQSS